MTQPVDRYLVALPRGEGKVFLSWRLLEDDASDLGFNIERRAPGDAKLNSSLARGLDVDRRERLNLLYVGVGERSAGERLPVSL